MLTGKQFGRYEIRSKIGAGGMGEVYLARDAELDRNIAVKILPFEFSSDAGRNNRFRQEARVVSALNHPNIITIYEVGENEHGSFLATEFVEGETLREIIKSLTISSSQEGVPNLFRLPLDGSPPQPITAFKSGKILNFAWSKDGANLFIVRGITNNDLILIRDSATSGAERKFPNSEYS